MVIKQKLRKILVHAANNWRISVVRKFLSYFITPYEKTRHELFEKFNISVVFDVGANIGQYAKGLQHAGYSGRIISFEPLNKERAILEKSTRLFENWTLLPYALGDANSKSIINIAGNSGSSSILSMNYAHQRAAPESKYIGTQEIEIRTLDSIFPDFVGQDDNVYLKIDTQGYEWQVLNGGFELLNKARGIELEMSFEELYENEKKFEDLYRFILGLGFRLFHIRPVFKDHFTLQLLQADCIFFKSQS